MTEAPEPLTPVIFRYDRGEVVAVFFTEVERDGAMTCYAHLGQHASCSLGWYRATRPATWPEYASLKAELEAAPYRYRLKVYQRRTRHAARKESTT